MAGLSLKRSRQAPAEETSAFGGVAERFRRAGDLDRAITLCREGLQRFPDLLSARVTLGWALLDKGEFAEARTELQQVLKRAPDNLAAIRGLAELHDRMDGSEGAMESWHQATESEAVEAPKAPKAPTRAAKTARGKSKKWTAAEPEPVAATEAEPETEGEPEAELETESEPELVASPIADAAQIEAPAILSAAAAAIEAAEAPLGDALSTSVHADELAAAVPAALSEQDAPSAPVRRTASGEVALESSASESVSRPDVWDGAALGESQGPVGSAAVSTGESWEQTPVGGESSAMPPVVDQAYGQDAWEDATALSVEPQTIELDAAAIADADLASEAVALAAQASVASERANETSVAVADADIVLVDAGDADEAAELERLLATVELTGSSSSGGVVLETVDQPVPLEASADVVPFTELVTAADAAMAETAEAISSTPLESPATLLDGPGVVALAAAEPVAPSGETVDEAQALTALPPLDLIAAEAPRTPAPVAEPADEPAAPEPDSHRPSAAYEPATWHQPAAWHTPASAQSPVSWPEESMPPTPAKSGEGISLSPGTPHSSRHAGAPRLSRGRAQVAALEKLLRRVEARRLRLQAQSVA